MRSTDQVVPSARIISLGRSHKPTKGGIISVFDVGTRTCVATILCFTSNSEVAAAAIAEAMVGWDGPDGTFVGGVPELQRSPRNPRGPHECRHASSRRGTARMTDVG